MSEAAGLILDIDRFSTHDGPGIRTTVFLKGCPLDCRWCHSPESRGPEPELLYQSERCTGCALCIAECPVEALALADNGHVATLDREKCTNCGRCPEVCYPGALRVAGRRMTVDELVAQVERDRPYFASSGGGMTLSGGEPAWQTDFAVALLAACQHRGIHTALETSGFTSWERMSRLASAADLILYDVKLADEAEHRVYTGVSNRRIQDNLASLAATHQGVHVRVPCIPGINDSEKQVRGIAQLVAKAGIGEITLLPYNSAAGAKYQWLDRPYPLADLRTQGEDTMARLAEVCRAEGLTVQVGG